MMTPNEGGDEFTPRQLQQLRAIFREEFFDVGLRTDNPENQEQLRKDFQFLRTLRYSVNGAASRLGWAVILSMLGAMTWLLTLGANTWRSGP